MQSNISKRLRVDFCLKPFAGLARDPNMQILSWQSFWLLRMRVHLSACRNFADVLKDQEDQRATEYIEYTCSPESLGRRFAAALLPRLFRKNRRSLLLDVNVMATLLQQVLKSQEQMQQMISAKQETHHDDVQYVSPVTPAGC